MIIHLAADHAGFQLKEELKKWLGKNNYQVKDYGAFVHDEKDDYPDFMHPAAKAVCDNCETDRGIIIGGSGHGEAMLANRYHGVRAAVFYGPFDEKYKKLITLSREHNNANILALAGRFLSVDEAVKAVDLWLNTPFTEEERHKRRIKKIEIE